MVNNGGGRCSLVRHWITIVCLIGFLLYAGWVLDYQARQAGAPPVRTQAGVM